MSKTFNSFEGFANFLLKAAVNIEKSGFEIALKESAKLVENTAKEEIGNYQPAMGEFSEWPQLKEGTQKDRASKGYTPNDPLLRSGKLRDSISSSVKNLEARIGSNLDIGVYQELGTSKIPPRPFLGTALFRNKTNIKNIIGTSVIKSFIKKQLITTPGYSNESKE